MKKICIAAIFTMLSITVAAQSSSDILRKVSDAVTSLGSYTAYFTVSSNGNSSNGYYKVSGNKFVIKAGILKLMCDGRTSYEIDDDSKEVTIDNLSYDETILSNPVKAFVALDSRFTHKLIGVVTDNGHKAYKLSLNGKTNATESFTLTVNAQTYMPIRLVYGTEGSAFSVLLVNIQANKPLSPSEVVFNRANYPDYEVIDMR